MAKICYIRRNSKFPCGRLDLCYSPSLARVLVQLPVVISAITFIHLVMISYQGEWFSRCCFFFRWYLIVEVEVPFRIFVATSDAVLWTLFRMPAFPRAWSIVCANEEAPYRSIAWITETVSFFLGSLEPLILGMRRPSTISIQNFRLSCQD